MKNVMKKVVVLMLTLSMLFGMTSAVQATPLIMSDPYSEGMQVIKGAEVIINCYYYNDGFETSEVDLYLYDSNMKQLNVSKGLKFEKTGLDVDYGNFAYPTTNLEVGTYMVHMYAKYLVNGKWQKALKSPAEFSFKVVEENSKLNGLVQTKDDEYCYYKNGKVDTSFTGFAGGSNKYFYVENGKVTFETTGFVEDPATKTQKLVESSLFVFSFTGVAANETGILYYVEDGVVKNRYSGELELEDGSTVYVVDGVIVSDCTKPGGEHVYKDYICVRCGKVSFVDVENGRFYTDAVKWAVKNHITTGKSETKFEPESNCTRGEVVTFLWRSAGCPEPTSTNNPFADVAPERFYYKAVLWAVENGITNGVGDATFDPNGTCTRGQIATFLHRYAGSPDQYEKQDNPFDDVANNRFYRNAVVWAYYNGVTTGVTEDLYMPEDNCTRAQIVTLLYRYYANN